jgi:hypothetical protein
MIFQNNCLQLVFEKDSIFKYSDWSKLQQNLVDDQSSG